MSSSKRSPFHSRLRSDRGITGAETALAMTLLIFIGFMGVDLMQIARYSSAAQWLALTASRIGSVARPDDSSGSPPSPNQLKLPTGSTTPAYLVSYQNSAIGCNGTPLSARHLRTLNLVLGEAEKILQSKAKTVSTWTDPTAVSAMLPKKGEMVIVPKNCDGSSANDSFTEWEVCINIPLIMLNSVYMCHVASAEVSGV